MSSRFPQLVCLLAISSFAFSAANAQPPQVKYQESPFAVVINRITQADAAEYAKSLSQELKVGAAAIEAYGRFEKQQYNGDVERPLTGSLFYLQKAMMPSVATLEFQEVKDEAAYEKLVRRNKLQFGGTSSELEGKDGKYKISTSFKNRYEVPNPDKAVAKASGSTNEETEDAPTQAISISVGGNGAAVDYQSLDQSEVIEEDGKFYRESTTAWERYYRYSEKLMYTSSAEAVWDMNLPTIDGVLKDASREVDMGAEVYLERIPMGLKTLGWNMLYGGMSTQMQQRDGESDVDYNFRSAGGKLGLAVAKAGMFDSDHISGAIQLADDQQPIRAHLAIDARKGSELSTRLTELSSGESRFAPIINDEAAFTLHFAARLPEESIQVFKTGGEFLKDQLMQQAGTDVDLVISGAEIAETLGQIADQNNLELFMKLGYSEASGGAIYGGMRVGDNPELLSSVLTLLTPESTPQDILDRFELTKKGDLDVIEFLIPSDEFAEDSPVRLSHLYIAHAHSCLWVSIGGENCYQILRQSIDRCEASGMRTNTRVFTAALDLEKWMSYPEEDTTGLTTLPQLADAMMVEELASEVGTEISDNSLMQRVIALGGRQDILVHLDSGASGLKLRTEIGKAFGNYMVARWMQAADSAMQNMEIPEPVTEAATEEE